MTTPNQELLPCPVCLGKGKVPNGFYLSVGRTDWTTSDLTPEKCQSCDGKGVIVVADFIARTPQPPAEPDKSLERQINQFSYGIASMAQNVKAELRWSRNCLRRGMSVEDVLFKFDAWLDKVIATCEMKEAIAKKHAAIEQQQKKGRE